MKRDTFVWGIRPFSYFLIFMMIAPVLSVSGKVVPDVDSHLSGQLVRQHLNGVIDVVLRGQITDENGPLVGVTVIEKGTSNGTTTNSTGHFKLNISNTHATIQVSYVGYQTKEIAVDGRSTINIRLEPIASELSGVVVTALGIKRSQRALGYSVSEVKGDDLTETNQGNVLNAMAGRVAGAKISQMNGALGSTVNIIIRGATSLNGDNQPLFVIDGVPVMNQTNNDFNGADMGNAISDLNPDDIASISVLKGPSAAALYGSRAGHGVVLITTKSGKGEGLGVSINSSFTLDIPYHYFPVQNRFATGKDGANIYGEGNNETWGAELDVGNKAVMWNSNGQEVPLVSYPNRFKDFFRNGQTYTNNVAVSGSNDKGTFRLSVGDKRSLGVIPNTNLKRNTINLNTTYGLSDNLSVTGSFNWSFSRSDNKPNINGNDRNDIVRELYENGPQIDISALKDYWKPGMEGLEQIDPSSKHNNPWFLAYENTNGFKRDRLVSKVQVDWDMTKALKWTARFMRDAYEESREGKKAYSTRKFQQGQYDIETIKRKETNLELNLSYNKQIGKDWNLNMLVGGNRRYQYGRNLHNAASQLVVPDLYTISNGVPGAVVYTSSWDQKAVYSVYGRASMGYKSMIYLDLTGRNDWSSTLPVNNRSYFYPSASLSVLLSEMFAMPQWISYLKLRGGIAEVGNDTNPYALDQYYSVGPDWGSAKELYLGGSLKNASLLPEQNTSKEVGFDFRFLNNKVGLSATYYISDNKNQILGISIPIESGATSKLINAGLLESRGWEISLNTTPVSTKDFTWDMTFNFSRNRTEIKELAEGITDFQFAENHGFLLRSYVGDDIGNIYVQPMLKVTDKGSPYNGWPLLSGSGQYQADENPDHLVKYGNVNPDFTLGVQPTLRYKAFSLSANIDWNQGGKFYSETWMFFSNNGYLTSTFSGAPYNRGEDIATQIKADPQKYFGKWVGGRTAELGGFPWPDPNNGRLDDASFNVGVREVVNNGQKTYVENIGGPDTKWLDPFNANKYAKRPFADRNIFNATYVKIREIALTYHLPSSFSSRLHIQNASVGIIASNLFEWTAAGIHIDPEQAYDPNGGNWIHGYEYYNTLPWIGSVGIKLNVNF